MEWDIFFCVAQLYNVSPLAFLVARLLWKRHRDWLHGIFSIPLKKAETLRGRRNLQAHFGKKLDFFLTPAGFCIEVDGENPCLVQDFLSTQFHILWPELLTRFLHWSYIFEWFGLAAWGITKCFFCKKDVSPSKQERKLFVWNLFESKNFPPKMVVFIWFFVLDLYFCLFHFFHASIRGSWSHGSDENRPNWSFFLNIPTKRTPVLRCPKKHCSSALVGIAGSHICKGRNKKHRNPQPRLTISHRDLPSGSAAPVLFLGWKIKLSYLGNKVEVAV